MAKILYDQHLGRRIKNRYFFDVSTFDGYWWSNTYQKWVPTAEDLGVLGGSNCFYPVRSVKAFRRRLQQWSRYLPPGVTFILYSKYQKYNVYGRTTK